MAAGSGAARPAAPTIRAQAACFEGGALLCARHAKGGEEYWVLPGGHVEPGETVTGALARELREETGLTLLEAELAAVGEFVAPSRHVLDVTFRVRRWEGSVALGADPEAESRPARLVGLAWIDRERFASIPFRPAILGRWLADRWDASGGAAWLGVERA